MNERIEKLVEQATIKTSHRYITWGNTVATQSEEVFDKEKFAELIVRECIGCCEQVISDPVPKSVDTFEQGGIHCMDEIKEHFGVE